MAITNERLGLSQAWPLFAVGLGALTIVAIATIFMILKYVIFPKRRDRVSTDHA